MADDADIARMEAHIANVAAVGPKWEKAVDKLRKQFPNDLDTVHKRLKTMVSESKGRKRTVLAPSTSTSASTSSKSSRKATKRPLTPPAVHRGKEDYVGNVTLTLPVKKKPLTDLSDEMTKDQYPHSKGSSSTITSFTSAGAEREEDRLSHRGEEPISLDGIDLPQSWTGLPENLMSIFATIDKPILQEDKKMEESASVKKDASITEMKKNPPNSTRLDKGGDSIMTAVGVTRSDKREANHVMDVTMVEAKTKAPAQASIEVEDTIMHTPKITAPSVDEPQARDTEMAADGAKSTAKETEDTIMTATNGAKDTAVKMDAPMNTVEPATTNKEDKDTSSAVEDESKDIKAAAVEASTSVKAEPNCTAQLQYNNIKDISLSNLAIDGRIIAHLASTGLTSTSYLMLKGIREDDIRPIVDAIAKAEGVGIVDGVLAARRIEEAFHAFQQQVYSPKSWGA